MHPFSNNFSETSRETEVSQSPVDTPTPALYLYSADASSSTRDASAEAGPSQQGQELEQQPPSYLRDPGTTFNTERYRLIERTQNLPIAQQWEEHQSWLDLLPQEHREEQTQMVLNTERYRLTENTQNLPIAQQRAIHQSWLDLLPQEHREEQTQMVLNTERYRLTENTQNLPIAQQWEEHQSWLDLLPQEHREEQTQMVLNTEWYRLTENTQNLLIAQQWEEAEEREAQLRDQHRQRVEQALQELQFDFVLPGPDDPNWSHFAADLLASIDEQEGLGSNTARYLGDILQGGINSRVNPSERDSEAYRTLLPLVLTRWQEWVGANRN